MTMSRRTIYLSFILLIFANSCHKCYECQQYCANCRSTVDSGIVYKFCAENDLVHGRIDSLRIALQGSGFNCSLLNDDKKVCDRPAKIKEAQNYYVLKDYYCVEM